jgi:hypothetical protein
MLISSACDACVLCRFLGKKQDKSFGKKKINMAVADISMYVEVEPVGDVTYDKATGVLIPDFVDQHLLKSLLMRVVSVPKQLPYYRHMAEFFGGEMGKRTKSPFMTMEIQRLTKYSVEYDMDVEVSPGDLVLVRHLANVEQTDVVRFVPYDYLVAKFRPMSGGLTPLNGHLLLEMDEDEKEYVDPKYRWQNSLTRGKVIAQGMVCNGYKSYPGFVDQPGVNWVGRTVYFRPYSAVRIENDIHRNLEYNTPWPYYRISKPQILGWTE